MAPTTHTIDPRIPQTLLLAGTAPGSSLSTEAALAALARGLARGGHAEVELWPLPGEHAPQADLRARLDADGFDVRMRASRAVVIVAPRLDEHTLAHSAAFDLATRARQAGVPAYAVTGENKLNHFDARVLDLQLILQARSRARLEAAGEQLAGVV